MPARKEIKHYLWLIWLGVFASLIGVAFVAFNLNKTLENESESAFRSNLQFLAESSAKSVKLFFDGIISEIVLLSEIDAVKEYQTDEVDLAFRGVISKHDEHISHMILLDNKSKIRVMLAKDPKPMALKSQIEKFFRETMSGWRVNVSQNILVSDTYKGLAVGMPIFRKFKRIANGPSLIYASGALMALVGVDDLVERLIDPVRVGKQGVAWLYIGDGVMLVNEDNLARMSQEVFGDKGGSSRFKEEFAKVFAGENVEGWKALDEERKSMLVESENEKWFIATEKVTIQDREWIYSVAGPQSVATQYLKKSFMQMSVLFLFVVLILLFGGFLVTSLNKSRVRAEEKALFSMELERKNKSLKVLNKRMDEFVSIVSHDIRSPLGVIVGFTKMIRSSPDGAKFERETTTMLRSSSRLLQLVNDILDVSRLENGKVRLSYETIIIDDVIMESVRTMGLGAKEKEQLLEVDLGEPTQMQGDMAKLVQVMNNLIANAIKFTPKGGKISVHKTTQNGNVIISVSDTGPGIPEEHQDMVFDKFEQLKHHQQGIEPGSGLGLTICKNLIDLHGGDIGVSSAAGEGSTFRITAPLHPL